jgi:hypothetical protein
MEENHREGTSHCKAPTTTNFHRWWKEENSNSRFDETIFTKWLFILLNFPFFYCQNRAPWFWPPKSRIFSFLNNINTINNKRLALVVFYNHSFLKINNLKFWSPILSGLINFESKHEKKMKSFVLGMKKAEINGFRKFISQEV